MPKKWRFKVITWKLNKIESNELERIYTIFINVLIGLEHNFAFDYFCRAESDETINANRNVKSTKNLHLIIIIILIAHM